VDVATTNGCGDARRIAQEAMRGRRRPAVVAVCGGDGTVHEAAGALAGTDIPLGIVPAGRGNDLAAALHLPAEVELAAAVLLDGVERRIDVGLANGVPFCTVAALGLDAVVALRTRAGIWRHGGRRAYLAAAAVAAVSFRPPRLRLTGDFGVREGRYLVCAVSNTGRYGGGLLIAPGSSPGDGLLDCCLVSAAPLWRVLRLLPAVRHGAHVHAPEVEVLRATALQVEAERPLPLMLDGEPAGQTPARFAVAPAGLTVLVPHS
jgi:diacylglycerol kinase (ATP)